LVLGSSPSGGTDRRIYNSYNEKELKGFVMKIFDRFEKKIKDEVKTKSAEVNWQKIYWAGMGILVVVCVTRKPQEINIHNYPSR
jgi:hypothetical protein